MVDQPEHHEAHDRYRQRLAEKGATHRERRFRPGSGRRDPRPAVRVGLFVDIFSKGPRTAFVQTHIDARGVFDPAVIDPEGRRDLDEILRADFRKIARCATRAKCSRSQAGATRFGAVFDPGQQRRAYQLLDMVTKDDIADRPDGAIDLIADDDVDMLVKGHIDRDAAAADRGQRPMIGWMDTGWRRGLVKKKFNTGFFTNGDSREPEPPASAALPPARSIHCW